MKALIFGCGYLGSRVARLWRDGRHEVSVLTRSTARADAFVNDGFGVAVGDVTEPDSLLNLPDADTVLYCVGFDRAAGRTKRDVYVDGLRNVLHRLPDDVQFVYVSSTSVYGESNGGVVDESSETNPSTEGGRVCLEAEQFVRARFDPSQSSSGSGAVILRLAGLYGPGRLLRRRESLLAGDAIEGNPDAFLNLIHVDDAATVAVAAGNRSAGGETFVVSDGHPVTRRAYFTTLAELIDAPPPRFGAAEADSARSRHVTGMGKRCSNAKLLRNLDTGLRFADLRCGLAHSVTGEG